ncbi:MAG: ATPase, partial [Rhodobacterales bacterium]
QTLTPDHITAVEVFDPDWTGGPATVETTFTETAGRTRVQVTITYSAAPARDQVLASGMGEGMAGSYALLEALL